MLEDAPVAFTEHLQGSLCAPQTPQVFFCSMFRAVNSSASDVQILQKVEENILTISEFGIMSMILPILSHNGHIFF